MIKRARSPPRDKKSFRFSLIYFLAFFLLLYVFNSLTKESPQTIQFSEFKQKVVSGEIKQIQMSEDLYLGYTGISTGNSASNSNDNRLVADSSSKVYRTIPVSDPSSVQLLDSKKVAYYVKPVSPFEAIGGFLLSWVVPLAMMLGFWWLTSNRMKGGMGGVMSFEKNRAQLVSEGDTGISFKDVAGVEEAKEELVEVVDFIMQPEKYEAIGGKIPKGVRSRLRHQSTPFCGSESTKVRLKIRYSSNRYSKRREWCLP